MRLRAPAYRAVRPLLFSLDAERVHHLTLRALALAGATAPGRAVCRMVAGTAGEAAPVELMGLRFRNRIGLAAGFDKDAVALRGWAALGLGFAEVGTVTPRPQPGSPRPRLFRLPADLALVNRMGFNNAGADTAAARLARARQRLPPGFVVGANLGRNRDTAADAAIADFLAAARVMAPVTDYLAVNVSSPNTPGLRELQEPAALSALLRALDAIEPRRPLLVKLSPDLEPAAFDAVIRALLDSPAAGVIVANTTIARVDLRSPPRLVNEAGGLSGAPLRASMLRAVQRAREIAGWQLAIVVSGGIMSGDDARAALRAGADLVQLWTGLVYRGPGLIGEAVAATLDAC